MGNSIEAINSIAPIHDVYTIKIIKNKKKNLQNLCYKISLQTKDKTWPTKTLVISIKKQQNSDLLKSIYINETSTSIARASNNSLYGQLQGNYSDRKYRTGKY